MKIKHKSIDIPKEDPFKNCKLGRGVYAEALTSIVKNGLDGFVLAINNEWGTGKTTFLNMWRQHMIKQNFNTLYLNAWENDLDSNPVVPIISEMKLLFEKNPLEFRKLKKVGGALIKAATPALMKGLAKNLVHSETLTDAIEKASEVGSDLLSKEIEAYSKKKESVAAFKSELQAILREKNIDSPLVFIVDELDRCRPDYAVLFLEQIKHFFSVEGIVFVIAIDKVQLGHAIRGYYGNNSIDVDEYLRRFIDLEYSIPEPDYPKSVAYFIDYYEFKKFFGAKVRSHPTTINDLDDFKTMALVICDRYHLSLRSQEKLFAHAYVAINSFDSSHFVMPFVFFYLLFIRSNNPILYRKIDRMELSLQSLLAEIENYHPVDLTEKEVKVFLYMQAQLLFMYQQNDIRFSDEVVVVEPNGKLYTSFRSKLVSEEALAKILYDSKGFGRGYPKLQHVLSRLNLTQVFKLSGEGRQ